LSTSPPEIRFSDVFKAFGKAKRPAVSGVSLDIPGGTFAVILGPSGCGKTTLLKTVNRLIEPSAGSIFVGGVDNATVDPVQLRRGMGYVIQHVGLFPHMTVAENIATVPRLVGQDAAQISRRVDELLELVHLPPGEYRELRPRALSGGQQQRVGLARALAADPPILLMDEPFGAVDAIERTHLQDEVAALHAQRARTVLFVTHDVDEAFRLADVLIVMRDGRVEQSAPPLAMLARPATPFVSDLIGADDVVRRLRAIHVSAALEPAREGDAADGPSVGAHASLGDALSLLLDGALRLVVRDGADVRGVVTVAGILRAARRGAVSS
jgi:osmoprotectant transport system ATP-binding protein